ncbi:hypothetical protein [Proteus faecis]|uniref:hypothetical protein n=1 Tax=Proteus faecis TaxID=2050967 RepID=UPI000D688489|nr:hypothetical protein [Proteus faecis]
MKGTTLTELIRAWEDYKDIISTRAHMAAGYPDRKRWREIMRVRKRRLVRGKKINRAYRVAKKLDHLEYLQWMNDFRGKKGLPKMIYTFGNSGTAKSQREASNAGN